MKKSNGRRAQTTCQIRGTDECHGAHDSRNLNHYRSKATQASDGATISSNNHLEILLPVEDDALCLDFPVLDVDFVAAEDNWYVFADPDQIPVPVRNIFVRHPRRNIEHDDGTLALNVVTIAEPTEFLLTSSIPDIEPDGPSVRVEDKRMHLHSQGGYVLLLELTRQVSLDEGRLSGTSIADQHALEGGNVGLL